MSQNKRRGKRPSGSQQMKRMKKIGVEHISQHGKSGIGYRPAFDTETDGRIIASIESIPGALAYGATKDEARANVLALAEKISQHASPT